MPVRDSGLDYQDRETVMWTDEFKMMDASTLNDEGRGGCEVNERVVVTDMLNIKVGEGMTEALREAPVKVISPDIRTLRNSNSNGGRIVGVFRHTLGRIDSY